MPAPSEMEERIAKALDGCGIDWIDFDGTYHLNEKLIHIARTAIEAMREPTPGMIIEGYSQASFGIGRAIDDESIARVWRGMIDAAYGSTIKPKTP